MESIKILPVEKPIVTSIAQQGCVFSVLMAYKKCHPWVFSSLIQLTGWMERYDERGNIVSEEHKPKYVESVIGFLFFDYYFFDVIPWFRPNSEQISRATTKMCLNDSVTISDLVRSYIDNDYYFLVHFDDFYDKKTDAYQKIHFVHTNLIYGYDLNHSCFYIGGYHQNQKYSFSKISFSEFESMYFHSEEYAGLHNNRLIKYDDSIDWDFDIEIVKNLLGDYAFSKKIDKKAGVYSRHIWDLYKENIIWGRETYSVLAKYVDCISTNDMQNLDYRPFQVLYDHKSFLVELGKYLDETNHLRNVAQITEKLLSIKDTMSIILNLVLKYQTTERATLLCKISSHINQLQEIEGKILEEFISLIY